MQSQRGFSEKAGLSTIKHLAVANWENLTDRQRDFAKKIWGVITYKWRWQIAMNVPYLAIFLLDRSIPAVHQFDMSVLETIASKIPIPAFLSSWMGL